MADKLTIAKWSPKDQPREKLRDLGPQALSDAELLAILVGSGTPGESAVDLMKRVLGDCHNNLNTLGKKTIRDLMAFKGIGEVKAITILAACELGKRRQREQAEERADLSTATRTYNYLHTGWAGAVNTPFRYWKTTQFHGGTAAPTIVHWPAGMAKEKEGTVTSQPCTFLDVMPTCLELAGASYPSSYNGNSIKPLCSEARSFVSLLQEKDSWDDERTLYWEHERGKAVRKGNWRLTALAGGGWQLFDLAHDLSETTNLAAEHPEKVRELKALWNAWARSVGLNADEDIPESNIQHGKKVAHGTNNR